MQAIKRKLRSRRGASITFALLLFLVCAVLSSVIIVAASTASGRMSKLAETDRRYYAVTSAAELMKDLLKQPVSIVKRTETTIVQNKTVTRVDKETRKIVPTGEVDENGQPLTEETVSTETTWTNEISTPVETVSEKEYLLLKEAKDIQIEDSEDKKSGLNTGNQISGDGALGVGLTTANAVNEAAFKVYKNENKPSVTIQLQPAVDSSQEFKAAFQKISMEEELTSGDRHLVLTIQDTDTKPYKLELHFQGTKADTISQGAPETTTTTSAESPSSTQEGPSELEEDGVMVKVTVTTTTTKTTTTETTKRTDTSISTVNWDLVDIRTHTAA